MAIAFLFTLTSLQQHRGNAPVSFMWKKGSGSYKWYRVCFNLQNWEWWTEANCHFSTPLRMPHPGWMLEGVLALPHTVECSGPLMLYISSLWPEPLQSSTVNMWWNFRVANVGFKSDSWDLCLLHCPPTRHNVSLLWDSGSCIHEVQPPHPIQACLRPHTTPHPKPTFISWHYLLLCAVLRWSTSSLRRTIAYYRHIASDCYSTRRYLAHTGDISRWHADVTFF